MLRRVVLSALFLTFGCAGLGLAQTEPPREPMLRIASEQHVAAIHAVAMTKDGSLIATGGDDQTIRLWRGADGAPADVVRIPIAPGEDGLIYSLAFAPSGKWLLAGGVSGRAWSTSNSLYLIRLDTGDIVTRYLVGGTLRRVAYGAFGDQTRVGLALSAATGGAVQVRDAQMRILFDDIELGGRPTWLEFAPNGDVIVSTDNGEISVYDAETFRKRTRRLGEGKPVVARVSPDGKLLAVGYVDRRAVEVFRMSDLTQIAALSGNVSGGEPRLNAVAWGPGAQAYELWAGGGYANADGRRIVRRWRDVGQPDVYDDVAVARDSLTMLEATPNGGVIFSAADPAWGVIEPDLTIRRRGDRQGAEFRRIKHATFAVSEDGSRLAFTFEPDGEIGALVYDMRRGVVREIDGEEEKQIRKGWRAPRPPERLTKWEDVEIPAFDGRPLRLGLNDRSLAADSLGDGFVIGGDLGLHVFGPDGALRARLRLPSAAFGVLSLDAERFVAALGDGTLRWFRLDGDAIEETGAFYFAREGRRWLAWLPDGRFDHSSNGGQELAGYHVNRAADERALWVEFTQLYRSRYAPELVRSALMGVRPPPISEQDARLDVPEVELFEICPISGGTVGACAEAGLVRRGFAPIMDPADQPTGDGARVVPAGTEAVLLRFRVSGAPGGLKKIDVFQNGRTTGATRGFEPAPDQSATDPGALTFERRALLLPGSNVLQVRVYAESGLFGQSDPVEIERLGEAQKEKPKLFMLAVGVNEYEGLFPALQYARLDAEAVARMVRERHSSSYGEVWITTLPDGEATAARVLEEIREIAELAGPGDSVALYLAGHGVVTEDQMYRYVTTDVNSQATLMSSALDQEALMSALGSIEASNILLMLDTCHSGAITTEETVGTIFNETGLMVLSASSTVQQALDSYDGQNGVFAYAVLRGLSGEASGPGGLVDATYLGNFVRDLVPILAAERMHQQEPRFFVRSGAKFPLTEPGR